MARATSKGAGHPLARIEVDPELAPGQGEELLRALKARFESNMHRHQGLEWARIQAKLEARPETLSALYAMDSTGGEPDVVGFDQKTGEYVFCDCAAQSPAGRRSICYDPAGQEEREKKGVHPAGNALGLAAAMGIEVLNEDQYRELQQLGEFDTKTSSWIQTPADIRKLGGAIFADRRYGHVFVYHNSAGSFYGARGFRGRLTV